MTKTEMLLIRACKSNNPHKRIKSVYRRRYYNGNDTFWPIAAILTDICEKYSLITHSQLITDLNPENHWKFGSVMDDYWTIVAKIMISRIRLTEVSKLEGLIAPIKFRRD